MKKLFVILAVLALASASFAASMALTVNAGDAKTIYAANDVITIEILAPSNALGFIIDGLKDDAGNGNASNIGTCNALWDMKQNGGTPSMGGLFIESIGASMTGTGKYLASGAVMWSMEYVVPNVVQDGITISAFVDEGNGYYTPKYTDYATSGDISGLGSVYLNLVPEPMTIALLGLGGLFLRRKLS